MSRMLDFDVNEWLEVGRVEIVSARDPVSLQASGARRASLKADLGAAVAAATTGVFLGDVEVTIGWYVSAEVRYGTHMIADIDNIVKPLLDAVTGPDGVMIDDNQVQSLKINWESPHNSSVKFRLVLEAIMPGEYLSREGLFFVEFSPACCFPVLLVEESDLFVRHAVRYLSRVFETHQWLVDHDASSMARRILPIQRFFPRSRLGRYIVRPSSDFL